MRYSTVTSDVFGAHFVALRLMHGVTALQVKLTDLSSCRLSETIKNTFRKEGAFYCQRWRRSFSDWQ